jgi:RNA polymerase sigma factor (sigma-70 family)
MTATAARRTTKPDGHRLPLNHVHHESLLAPDAARSLAPEAVLNSSALYAHSHMPDEVTRDCAKRMHYAAYRHGQARSKRDAELWKQKYYDVRDLIVLGNQKLVYHAVRKQMSFAYRADDMIGEGHIVLIRAVAAFNPWLGIRFSTYAFTCLMRAFCRLTQQFSADWLSRSLALDGLPGDDLAEPGREAEQSPLHDRLNELLRQDHPLLSEREKYVLCCRYHLAENCTSRTLAEVGEDLGLSKERVRQVQSGALDKLRQVLASRG